ncbi:MAG: hypothetical protein ACLFVR_00590 [Thiohalospira sp.]
MNKIKLTLKRFFHSFRTEFEINLFLSNAHYDLYILCRLKELICKMEQEGTFDESLFLGKAQNFILQIHPDERDMLKYNLGKLDRIKTEFIEIIKKHPMILISYLQKTDLKYLSVDNLYSQIMSSKLPLAWKIKNINPEQKRRIIHQTKEWWSINRNKYEKQVIILLGALLFDMNILEIKKEDNRKNRLEILKKEITKDAYDDIILKNTTYIKSNKKNLLSHYDKIISFFRQIDFYTGIEFVNENLKQIN